MPQFNAGAVKTATVTFTNPKAMATSYVAVLYMGGNYTPIVESSFSLNAGESKQVTFSVTMPMVAGVYPVYIGVFSGGVLIPPMLHASEDVTVLALPIWVYSNATIDTSWQIGVSWWNWLRYTCIISNPNSFDVTKGVSLCCRMRWKTNPEWFPDEFWKTYQITIPANGSYVFDSCLIEGILGPGFTNGETFHLNNDMAIEAWIKDSDGTQSDRLEAIGFTTVIPAGMVKVVVKDTRWVVELADTPAECYQGLNGRLSVEPRGGMLFDLGYEQYSYLYNMSNMYFPVDIIYISTNKAYVLGITRNLPPLGTTVQLPGPLRYFMVVNGGEAVVNNTNDPVTITYG